MEGDHTAMNINTHLADDPKITAYVLGELDAEETKQFEQEMQQNPQLHQLVQDTRKGIEVLNEVVSQEAASELCLDPVRRKALDDTIRAEQGKANRKQPFWYRMSFIYASSAAAVVILLIGLSFPAIQGSLESSKQVAAAQEPQFHLRTEEGEEIRKDFDGSVRYGDKLNLSEAKDESSALALNAPGSQLRREMKPGEAESFSQASLESPLELSEVDLLAGEDSLREMESDFKFTAQKKRLEQPLSDSNQGTLTVTTAPSAAPSVPTTEQGMEGAASMRVPMKGDVPLVGRAFRDGDRRSVVTSTSAAPSRERMITESIQNWNQPADKGNEGYSEIQEKGFTRIVDAETGTSTFSADVDTASYANIRRYLNSGQLPPADAVRIEEMINYFSYDYAEPDDEHPFASNVQVASCPWQPKHRLARIGIKAAAIDADERKPMNLVFLIDVSGSMRSENKLPLLKRAMQLLVKNLNEDDRVAIVTYAGSSGLVLDSTPVSDKHAIISALDRLKSGGSTAGAAGIELAYRTAREHLIKNGQNRVILCTDGDFNVGVTNNDDLVELVRKGGKDGVFLSIFGFGMGNIKDDRLEKLSNDGNGNYGYIDSFQEAQKVFGEQLQGTLATVAKDVKFQIEFNPSKVAAYRLIGYENRMLAREDFNDDTKDAGEVGAGHTVTALYEIVPVGVKGTIASVDEHRYVKETNQELRTSNQEQKNSDELFFLKIRYKDPEASTSQLMTFPIKDSDRSYSKAGGDFQFAAAVAQAGQLLRGSKYAGEADWDTVLKLAREGRGEDPHGYRAEFIRLSEVARGLMK
jgi:Ca-activated chloride channel family protein